MSAVVPKDLVIIGAGGFGREILDVVNALSGTDGAAAHNFLGFIDDGLPDQQRLGRLAAKHLGGAEALQNYRGAGFVVGIADAKVRAKLTKVATEAGLVPVTLIHPTATLGADVEIGEGTVICAGVRITTNIRIGRHVHLNLNVTVGHDTVIEDFVSVNPLAAISGDVVLHEGVMVGTTACINQGLTVGAGAVVGSGAALVKHAEPGVTVVGVPARPLGR